MSWSVFIYAILLFLLLSLPFDSLRISLIDTTKQESTAKYFGIHVSILNQCKS